MPMLDVKGFVNCKAYLKFKPLVIANAFLVVNGKVVYVGDEGEVIKLVDELGGELVDLKGRVVLPGFVDAHLHLTALGESLRSINLRGVKSIDEVKTILKDYLLRSSDYWLIGYGWDQELFPNGKLITRLDLDEVVSDRPLILIRSCMHVAILNSKALSDLRLLERFKGTPNFLPDEGLVREEVLYAIMDDVRRDLRKAVNDLKEGINHLLANGVTTVGFVECDLQSFYALQLIKINYGLPIRIRVYLSSKYLSTLSNLGVLGGLGDDYLRVQGVKLFIDGSLGARTALLSKPYSDLEESIGIQVISKDELLKSLNIAFNHKLQVAIHAIGDRAIDIALNAYLNTFGNVGKYRHRIEHLSIIRPDQVAMAKELGVVGVVQPHFILSDWWVVSRVGLERVHWVYPLKTLYQNLHLAISSDAPVEPVNPWETIYAAVTRGLYEDLPLYKHTHNEVLTMIDTLHAYTIGSSYALFDDNVIGSLEPGKYADFILVDKDPLELDVNDVRKLRILETYVGGSKVYSGH